MSIIIDSYSETNQSGNDNLFFGECNKQGMSFTGKKALLTSCKFYIKKRGTLPTDVTAALYAHSGTFGTSSVPTGSALAVSDVLDESVIPTANYSLVEFTFSGANQYSLEDGVNYCIELRYNGGDFDNMIYLGIDSSSPTAAGNRYKYYVPASTMYSFSEDVIFYVYGKLVLPERKKIPLIGVDEEVALLDKRVVTTTDDATAVIDVDITDVYELSAIANATTFTTTGTPTDGQTLIIRFKDAGTTKGLTFTGFTAIGVTLPTDTTAGKWHYVECQYNLTATAWHVIDVKEQA